MKSITKKLSHLQILLIFELIWRQKTGIYLPAGVRTVGLWSESPHCTVRLFMDYLTTLWVYKICHVDW
jgi:hypothetical protein